MFSRERRSPKGAEHMGALDTVNAFTAALNAQQWDTVASYLTDDFVFSGVTPQPVGKQAFIAGQQAWFAGAPDWRIALDNPTESGDTVQGMSHVSGTHTGTLALPGMPPFAATGRRFNTTDQNTATVRGNQLSSITIVPGSPGIPEQLGMPRP
jgi:predicted ester cyclase